MSETSTAARMLVYVFKKLLIPADKFVEVYAE